MKADIKEYAIPEEVLTTLLLDRTTGENILWGCEDYNYPCDSSIKLSQIEDGTVIVPRFAKSSQVNNGRKKGKGEVFTPLAIVKKQNDIADEGFTGTWEDYVRRTVLEITCGEAPYLVNRYDVVTGEVMLLHERQGLLDRKLIRVSENTETEPDWKEYALIALKSTYGFEWQGDSLLIARENVLETMKDYFYQKFPNGSITMEEEIEMATIISYNLIQMDGVSCYIPYLKIPAKVMNWETNRHELFKPSLHKQLTLF